MKKRIFMVAAVFLAAVIFYNYVDITTTILSRTDYKEDAIEAIKINVEPEDRLGEIVAASLDSIVSENANKGSHYKDFKYIAIDAEAFHELSKADKQYLINYFKKYNDKVIYASKGDLRKLLLYNPINKSYNGGILLSVNNTKELTKEKAILNISYHVNKYDGKGYTCSLAFKNNAWKLHSIEIRYMP